MRICAFKKDSDHLVQRDQTFSSACRYLWSLVIHIVINKDILSNAAQADLSPYQAHNSKCKNTHFVAHMVFSA